jgi:hypothetical protein
MGDKMYDELALERAMKVSFGVDADIRQAIVFKVPVSRTAEATLFLTTKKQLYLYITGKTKLLLGDIKKIVAHMGLKAELYLPPKGHPLYFDEIGRSKFSEVFPGRSHINNDDIIFYKTLAPYNPALVLISEVKNGAVYQFDTDSNTNWRLAAKFTYRRIKTS